MAAEINNLVAMYSPEGFNQVEHDQLVKSFCEILPLDRDSQKKLAKQLAKLKEPEKISQSLTELLVNAYAKREKQLGSELMREIEKFVFLRSLDRLWVDHLDAMDDLREGIGLRGDAQSALAEYKKEAYSMFERLMESIDHEVVRRIFRIQVAQRPPIMPRQSIQTNIDEEDKMGLTPRPSQASGPRPVIAGKKKIGRNDPCWCGSGKKWKKCHYPQTGSLF